MTQISGLSSVWDGWDFSYLLSILLGVIPSLICITLHELSHGYVAYRLGDDTAKRAGRLTLNPLKHLDPVGLLMMLVFRVGWAKPVPVNMYRFKNPKRGMAITALAGPVSNILITIVFLFIYGLLYIPLQLSDVGQYILQMIMITAYISLGLAVFNFIPVPPLDGSKVLAMFLPDRWYGRWMQLERYGMIVLMAALWFGLLDGFLMAARNLVLNAMLSGANFAYLGMLSLLTR